MDEADRQLSPTESQCRYTFQDVQSALRFKEKIVFKDDLHAVKTSGPCRQFFPGSVALLTSEELEASMRDRLKLVIPYSELKDILKNKLPSIVDLYLTDFDQVTERPAFSCNRNYKIVYYFYAKNWPMIEMLFNFIANSQKMIDADVEEVDLKLQLQNDVRRIADHIIKYANTTDYHGIEGDLIGWNNLNSEWDASNNCTFSSSQEPNLYSSSSALLVLAKAYEITREPKYIEAFERGARYWHTPKRSGFFTDLPPSVFGPFSLGGTGYDADLLNAQNEPPLRYHYYFDDPGRYSKNCNAAMALAMIVAGNAAPEKTFPIPSYQNLDKTVSRSWREIGLSTMAVLEANIRDKNYSYYDITDPEFSGYYDGKSAAGYSTYLNTELYALAESDKYSGKDRTQLAVSTVNEILANPAYDKSGVSGWRLALESTCELRYASESAFSECKDIFSKYQEQLGSTALENPYILWAITLTPNSQNQ